MPEPSTTHQALTSAVDRLIVICDSPAHGDGDIDTALNQLRNEIAASTGEVLLIATVQDTLPASIQVHTHPHQPDPLPGWTGPVPLQVHSFTGTLMVDQTGAGPSIDGIHLPHGPGRYHATVWHRGRDHEMREQLTDLRTRLQESLDTPGAYEQLRDTHAGIEQYTVQIWPAK